MTLPGQNTLEEMVNLPELLARVDYDRELLQEIAELFREEFPRLRELLRSAVLNEELPGVEMLAHTLKGMLLNVSVERGAAAASELELRAKAQDLAGMREAHAEFEGAVDCLLPSLDAYIAGGQL
ncbi:MAG: Hpt domain-containing protein [Acidobacteriaceae bacterium]